MEIIEQCDEPRSHNANEMDDDLLLDFVKRGLLPVYFSLLAFLIIRIVCLTCMLGIGATCPLEAPFVDSSDAQDAWTGARHLFSQALFS